MFGKKKIPPKPVYTYIDWEKDLGFLNLIMSRKQNITINFLIKVRNKQLQARDYLRDEDIDPLITNGVSETLSEIGDNYKNFLIEKYFGSIENLTKYITEDFYVTLVGSTINENNAKIKLNSQRDAIETVNRLNASETQKKK